ARAYPADGVVAYVGIGNEPRDGALRLCRRDSVQAALSPGPFGVGLGCVAKPARDFFLRWSLWGTRRWLPLSRPAPGRLASLSRRRRIRVPLRLCLRPPGMHVDARSSRRALR